ncbi:MAG: hypothetical protein ACYTFM_02795 [Planctomycetota bacterium]|jgi:hypothetical protein
MANKEHKHTEKEEMILSEPRPVCPNCFQPCEKFQDYCPNCGSNEPINPLSSYMPFVRIRFQVGMFHKIWRKTFSPDVPLLHKVFFVFVILIGAPILLFIGLPLLFIEKVQDVEFRNTLKLIFWAIILSAVFLFIAFQIYDLLKPPNWRF